MDQPYALPSKCAFCGIGHNEDGKRVFVDTTLDLDWYGVVYICSTCFIEVAQTLGFMAPDVWEKVVESSTDSLIENEQLKGENEGLRLAVSTLSDHRCYRPLSGGDPGNHSGADEAPALSGDALESGKPESSDTPEPDDSKGLPDVRGNAADDSAEHGKPARKRSGGSILDELI